MHGATTGVVQLIVYVPAGWVAPAEIASVIGAHELSLLWTRVIVVEVIPAPFAPTAPQLPPGLLAASASESPPVASPGRTLVCVVDAATTVTVCAVHPIVVTTDVRLVAGLHRLRACAQRTMGRCTELFASSMRQYS